MATKQKTAKKTAKKKVAKQEGLNISQLQRDAASKKVTQTQFNQILTSHYKEGGRDKDWIEKRIEYLWKIRAQKGLKNADRTANHVTFKN